MCFAAARRIRAGDNRSPPLIGAGTSLASLFGASFLASTLLPISSEAALFAVLRLVGDALRLAAGWARLNWVAVAL
jgi:membrane protein YqaA with SNARE-associated domain